MFKDSPSMCNNYRGLFRTMLARFNDPDFEIRLEIVKLSKDFIVNPQFIPEIISMI